MQASSRALSYEGLRPSLNECLGTTSSPAALRDLETHSFFLRPGCRMEGSCGCGPSQLMGLEFPFLLLRPGKLNLPSVTQCLHLLKKEKGPFGHPSPSGSGRYHEDTHGAVGHRAAGP